MKKLTFLIFILCSNISIFAQITVNYVTAPYGIEQLVMYEDTLLVIGHTGEFYKSYDYGKTFTQFNNIPIEPNGYCYDFQIINNNFYYATRSGFPNFISKINKSSDNGLSWSTIFNRNIIANDFLMVDTAFGFFLDETFDTAWVANGSDTLWNWHYLNTNAGGNSLSVKNNDSTITIFRSTSSWQTTDRGLTWQNLNSGCGVETLLNAQYINADTIYFIGYDAGIEYNGRFLYSYDGGNTIQETRPGYNETSNLYNYKFYLKELLFLNSKQGFLFGSFTYPYPNSNIMFTQDFGQTFEPLFTGFSEKIYSVEKANDSILVMGGDNGIILRWNMNQPLGYLKINEQTHKKNISLQPNPLKTSTTFIIPQEQLPATLIIYNMQGQKVISKLINDQHYILYKNNLSNGMYVYSINGLKGKMIVE